MEGSGRGSCPAVGLSSQSHPMVVELTVARVVRPITAWYGIMPAMPATSFHPACSPGICAGRPSLWRQQATGLAYRSVLSLHRALRATVLPTLHCRYSAPHSLRTQIPAGSSRAFRHVTSATHAREATALEYMNQRLSLSDTATPHTTRTPPHSIQRPRRIAYKPPA